MPLIGRQDAWALTALGCGLITASPWLAGDPRALLGLLPPAAGGAWLAWRRANRWLDRTDTRSREGFVLPSDKIFPECMSQGTGLRLGYTTDRQLPLDVGNEALQRHTA